MGIIDFTNKRITKKIINTASEETKETSTEFVKKYGKNGMITLTKVWCADKIYTKCRRCQRIWNKYKNNPNQIGNRTDGEDDYNIILDEKQYCKTCNQRLKALNILRGV